jgi:hypothetical protein
MAVAYDVAYGVLNIVDTLPDGYMQAREARILGDARCNSYTKAELVDIVSNETFVRSVHDVMIQAQNMSRNDMYELMEILSRFTMDSLCIKGLNEPLLISLNEMPCWIFNMENTRVACRVILGTRVTHASLDALVQLMEVPPQMVQLSFSIHNDMVIPDSSTLRSVTVKAVAPRSMPYRLTVPNTDRPINYFVSLHVALVFDQATMATIGYDSDSSDEEPPRQRARFDSYDEGILQRVSVDGDDEEPRQRERVEPTRMVVMEEGTCSACLEPLTTGSYGFKAYPCLHLLCEGCSGRLDEECMSKCPFCR